VRLSSYDNSDGALNEVATAGEKEVVVGWPMFSQLCHTPWTCRWAEGVSFVWCPVSFAHKRVYIPAELVEIAAASVLAALPEVAAVLEQSSDCAGPAAIPGRAVK
jgi:hypothetical protein